MTVKEKLLEFAREKKIFRARDAETVGGASSRVYLNRLLAEGKITKAGHGLYSIAENSFTEMQDFLEVAVKVPRGVLCLLSALRFHDLTTQNPFEVWLTIENKMRTPKVETVPVRFFRFAPAVYEAGIELHRIEGVEVKVYSAAKTVADCFYFRKTVGLNVAIEALRDAWRQGKATIDEMYRFAEIRNIKNVIFPHLYALSV